MVIIAESGLSFGPFADGHCFNIEKSATYTRVQHRVPMAEFLLLQLRENRPSRILIVEAKSSSPRSGDATRFDQFIEEVRAKLTNGLALWVAAHLKRHKTADAELSAQFKSLDLAQTEFRLVLIIKDHQPQWLGELQDALRKKLHAVVKTWALGGDAVVVPNESGARKHGLVL